ncbi:MAG TPA: phosphoglycerate kinase [Solirubrobacteraceae bacterium]|nr:phosphoglycerate kinase [Solirubrobacteraceae bacterium]
MRTLADLDVEGRRVLVRVDFNVPLEAGEITDDTRIREALPTIEELRRRGARIILVSHLGRPKGDRDPSFSLRPCADRLAELIGAPVALAPGIVGPEVTELVGGLGPGDVAMLENIRYEPGELTNDPELAGQLAELADVYVNDAFGAAHRAHASTEGVARAIGESCAGLLLEREVTVLGEILANPARPLVAVVGGAKVTDKLGVIERFLELADVILIGGAMCFPFFKAQGHDVGGSLCEEAGVDPARRALDDASRSECELLLPTDLVIADRFAADADHRVLDGIDVPDGWMGLDVGPATAELYAERIASAGTVFWNGPMGAFELEPFAAGTRAVADAIVASPAITVVGGGDSAAALTKFGLQGGVTHLSTGGGATLEMIEGRELPALGVLRDRPTADSSAEGSP